MSLLKPYHESYIRGRTLPPSPLMEIDNEIEYGVEKILDSSIKNRHLEYLIYWQEYDIDEHT